MGSRRSIPYSSVITGTAAAAVALGVSVLLWKRRQSSNDESSSESATKNQQLPPLENATSSSVACEESAVIARSPPKLPPENGEKIRYKENDWFWEVDTCWPGQSFGLRVKKVLFQESSEYQDILVFESARWGNVLVLDGAIQCTSHDEFVYQEMMAHVPLNALPSGKKGKRILIIGGGDGGCAREVLKHGDSVECVVQVEIDEMVVRCAKEFFPSMACSYADPKVKLLIRDGYEFAKECAKAVTEQGSQAKLKDGLPALYDVIIVDSSDPEGPAGNLFTPAFYQTLFDMLDPQGICVCQGECPWIHGKIISQVVNTCSKVFPVVDYSCFPVPTYPSGSMGMLCLAKCADASPSVPRRGFSHPTLNYYSEQVHMASFMKPKFIVEAIGVANQPVQPSRAASPTNLNTQLSTTPQQQRQQQQNPVVSVPLEQPLMTPQSPEEHSAREKIADPNEISAPKLPKSPPTAIAASKSLTKSASIKSPKSSSTPKAALSPRSTTSNSTTGAKPSTVNPVKPAEKSAEKPANEKPASEKSVSDKAAPASATAATTTPITSTAVATTGGATTSSVASDNVFKEVKQDPEANTSFNGLT